MRRLPFTGHSVVYPPGPAQKGARSPASSIWHSRQGFSLFEVVISLLIFTLALFTLLGTIGQFTRSAHADKQQLRMDLFARELLDQVRAAVGESNFATEGFFVAFSTSNYTLGTFPGLTATRGIGPFMGNGTRLVTVTISGRSGGAPMERTYQLLLTRSDVAGGGVNVPVRVVEAYPISETAVRETTRGVVNANVRYPRADLEGDWRSQTTDDNGDVILRNVLISSSVVLRVYKYGVTPDVQFSTDTRIQRINQGYYWLGDSSEHQETVDTRRYLREDQQTPVPIALIPLGHVRGQVVDPATDGGGPVPGATVRLYTPSHYGLSVDTTVPAGPWRVESYVDVQTSTDPAGVYSISNVWPGQRRIWLRGKRGIPPTHVPSGPVGRGYLRSFLVHSTTTVSFIPVQPFDYTLPLQSPNLAEYNRPATWQTEPTTHWRAERLGGVKVILKKGKLADIGTMYSLTEDGDVLLEPIDARWIDVGSISVNAPQGVWVDLGTLVRFTEPTRQNLDQYRTRTPAFEGDLRFSGIAFNFYNLFGASMDQDINGFMYANYRMQDGYLPIQLRTQEWDCTTNIPSQYYFPDIAGYWSGRPPNLALRVYKNKDPGPAPAGNQIVIPVLPASYWATVTGRITAPGVGGVDGATVSIDGCGGTRSTTTVNGDYTLTKVLPSFLKESHPCDTCTNKWRQLTILIATDTASVEFIRGTVHRDSESGPFVEGASVTITTPRTYPATTDGSGYFNVDQPAVGGEIVEYSSKTIVAPCLTPPCPPTRISQQMQLSPGYTAMAVVKKAGYAPTTRGPQTLSPRTGWDLGNIPLIQLKVTVTGRLTDAAPEDEEFAGQPIYDKSIQVWNEDRDDWVSTTTAPSGRYTFQDLPVRSRGLDGPYYVTIQVPAGTGLVRPYGDLQRPPVNRYYDTYGPRDLPQPNLTQVNTAAPWTVITIDLPLNGRGQL